MHSATKDPNDMQEVYIQLIYTYIKGLRNDTIDFTQPHINLTFINIYPVLIFVYAKLIILGTIANISMIYHIARSRLYEDPTCIFLVNIAISNIVHLVIALPVTFYLLLIENWIFGHFLCFCLPILQVDYDS